MVLTNRMGGNMWVWLSRLSFPKVLGLSGTTEVTTQRLEEKQLLKCSDSGMQHTWVQILVPHFVRFVSFLNLSEPSFPYLCNRNNNII